MTKLQETEKVAETEIQHGIFLISLSKNTTSTPKGLYTLLLAQQNIEDVVYFCKCFGACKHSTPREFLICGERTIDKKGK